MRALILSGGGALGAFQVGAERYLREEKDYRWDLIAGVSTGALNGAMLATGRHERLYELWWSISDNLVFDYGRWIPNGLLRLKSVYTRRKLRDLLEREVRPYPFTVKLRVGAVNLITGKYKSYSSRAATGDMMYPG
jgi:NTE family protein